MDRNFVNTGEYLYSSYSNVASETENNTSLTSDILQHFPYLRQGTNFGAFPATLTTSQQEYSSPSADSERSVFTTGYSDTSTDHHPSITNSTTFLTQASPGVLPSVATFTSSLPQNLTLNIPTNVSDTGESTAHSYNTNTETTRLPGFHNLAARTLKPTADSLDSLYTSYTGSGILGPLVTASAAANMQNDHSTLADHSRLEPVQSTDHGSSLTTSSDLKVSDNNATQNFYNLVNHAVKMEPVHIPHTGQVISVNAKPCNSSLIKAGVTGFCSNTGEIKTTVHSTNTNQSQPMNEASIHYINSIKHKTSTSNVRFYLKGRFGDKKPRYTAPRSTDTIDELDNLQNPHKDSNSEPSTYEKPPSLHEEATELVHQVYKEPSIADIRASLEQMNKLKDSHVDNLAGIPGTSNSLTEGFSLGGSGSLHESWYSAAMKKYAEFSTEDDQGFSLGGAGSLHESWYSAAMKKYAEFSTEDDQGSAELSGAKRGGRSDPDNPFAITSPSFSESAARALMTTTNSATGTTVRISIMSIGSRKKLMTNIVNSQAAHGGLVSIVNPITDKNQSEITGDCEVKTDTTSIMSKLKRERQDKIDETEDKVVDCLDIDIHIDDDQFIGEGSNKRWLCKICPKSYTTKHNLLAHILDHSSIKPHLCLVCGKYFKQLSHLNTHMLTHDHVKPYKCEKCGKGFTQISHLKRHETVHLESKPYICDICNRGFAYPSELRIHKDKHINGKEKCTDCDQEFNSLDELKEHMTAEKHGDDLTCKHCHRVFKYPSQLRDHMMSHGGPRPYICTECGMDFMKEHHLKAHLFTHTGLRPYSCPHCHRAFNQKANMVRHMLIHEPERAFKCEVCSKTFTQPQTLKAHMVVHSDKKPYSCKFCGKQFGRQHNLQGHLHMHMNSKPYVCSICQASFTLKGNLNRHKKVKHGLNESTENMEEDAVNFLSSFSNHMRDAGTSETELDTNSHDDHLSPDSKSSKKGRKSTPKKRVTQQIYSESEGDFENIEGSDNEDSNIISYSDEERENETRLSKYFTVNENEADETGIKRKRKVAVALFKNMEGNCDKLDVGDNALDIENEVDFQRETNIDGVIAKPRNSSLNKAGVTRFYNNTDDIQNELSDSKNVELNTTEGGDGVKIEAVGTEKRSKRKRKKKEFDDDFLSDVEAIENYSNDIALEPARKTAKHKGAMLDNIIAAKFKNM